MNPDDTASTTDAFLSSCRSRVSSTLSPLSTPSTTTSRSSSHYRPWSMEDYLERVFGYTEIGWCIRPSTVHHCNSTSDQDNECTEYAIGGPIDAALHGWRAVSPGEGVVCVTCDAKHYLPWPTETPSPLLSPSEELESCRHLLALYHDKLVTSGHERTCPWRRRACDAGFVGRRVKGSDDGLVEKDGSMACVYGCARGGDHAWVCPYSQRPQRGGALNPGILLRPSTLESLSHLKGS